MANSVRQPILRFDPLLLLIADTSIVDHGVEAAKPIDLIGNRLHVSDAREIAYDDGLSGRRGGHGRIGARAIAAMQHHPMALFDQQLSRHQTKSGR